MFHIDERYSGKEKRNSIGFYKGKELDRQKLRKKLHPITRELDNYFHHKLHKRGWWPNGLFLRKQYYYYAQPGLGCFYEKNNVEQLRDLGELKKETKKNLLKNFVEYNYIEDNQYIITIEYCSNCEEHKTHTFHRAEMYKNYAISLQKCILLRFPFIKVILKPIETDILKEEHYKLPKVDLFGNSEKKYVNDKFKDVRIGAFEIQICYKKPGAEIKKALLHSKLQTKQFPEILKILDKIVSFLPSFTGQIVTYEKEEELGDNKKNNIDEVYKKGLLEGLQINIYLLNNLRISSISTEAWNDIQTQQNPHKRQLMIKEQKLLEKENLFKNNSILMMNDNNRIRPLSSITGYKNGKLKKSQSAKNIERPSTSKTFLLGNNRSNLNGNNISVLSNSLIQRSSMNNYILDKTEANNLKGKLILTKYTNADGYIDIGPLPYDSYFIEVQESRQYRSIGFCLKFNTLNLKNKNFIKKYIGLFIQENSFIQLNIYEVNKDKNGVEDPVHLGQTKVTLKRIYSFDEPDNNINNNLENNENDENMELKIALNEKPNSPGIFEHTVPPGQYLLEVEKKNYETIRKFIDLDKGANTINVEMSIERCCNLHIFVYNYEKFQEEANVPIHNVDVVIYQSANEILEESITNEKGEVNYLVNKGEDFLTVVVSKLGYYPVQRVFIRNKEAQINEKGEYEENLIFFLVKESFIRENNCILCVTYSNLYDINFDPNSIQISDNVKNKLSLSCYDGQQENGVISTFIQYLPKNKAMQKNINSNENNNNVNIEQENEQNEEGNINNENNEIINNNENNENIVEEEEVSINKNNEENAELENYDDIISLSFIIQTDSLKFNNYQDKGFTMNGLERYGCQTIIYMPKNMFYLTAPKFCNEGYCIWNLGWIDVKNQLFYQTNTLTETLEDRIAHFSGWLEFLQSLIDDKIYSKLFEFFNFDKANLIGGDRLLNEEIFVESLKGLKFCKNNENDIIEFILNTFRHSNKIISFNLVKRKISSNLKNFSDEALAESNYGDDGNNEITSQMANNEGIDENNEENNE